MADGDSYLSTRPIIGAVQLVAASGITAQLSTSRIIGAVQLMAGIRATTALLSTSRILGAVKLYSGGGTNSTRLRVSRIIGKVKLLGKNDSDAWGGFLQDEVSVSGIVIASGVATATTSAPHGLVAVNGILPTVKIVGAIPTTLNGYHQVTVIVDATHFAFAVPGMIDQVASGDMSSGRDASLPLPRLGGYTYTKDAGVVRTPMDSGRVRQRRRWMDGMRTATLMFDIAQTQIGDFEAFLEASDYDWFQLSLVTGNNATPAPELHTVRIISDPKFGTFKGGMCAVTIEVETE